MKILNENQSDVLLKAPDSNFVVLNNNVLADYALIYRINNSFSVSKIEDVYSKHQLHFQKFQNRAQQNNLTYLVDSFFPLILADLTLEVLLKRVSRFQEYIHLKKPLVDVGIISEENYLKHKFIQFIHALLYTNVASRLTCQDKEYSNKVFCIKNELGAIDFYSIYEQNKLQELLLDKLKLEVKADECSLSKSLVKINLRISV